MNDRDLKRFEDPRNRELEELYRQHFGEGSKSRDNRDAFAQVSAFDYSLESYVTDSTGNLEQA